MYKIILHNLKNFLYLALTFKELQIISVYVLIHKNFSVLINNQFSQLSLKTYKTVFPLCNLMGNASFHDKTVKMFVCIINILQIYIPNNLHMHININRLM